MYSYSHFEGHGHSGWPLASVEGWHLLRAGLRRFFPETWSLGDA